MTGGDAADLLRLIGRRVRLARLIREMTQAELGSAAGMSRSFISLIEQGSLGGVDIVRLHRLSVVLHIPLPELVGTARPGEPSRRSQTEATVSPTGCEVVERGGSSRAGDGHMSADH